ncbi:MAG: malto-oligosyltrehalose synthase [Alphaproteobacteria bacterium]|nr:malto-oligosyltrehalose synthase [Alphaproteobacteria bacterium]
MIPRATYRLQFHKNFTFDSACPLAPYLKRLGISHVYASPILKARPGSMHGYDVTDHAVINAELGGEEGFARMAAALREHGLGIVLDIVPNHMAVHADNRWWLDVLRNGRDSAFANFFDIDWDMLDGKFLAPVLGKSYWETLEAGEITVGRNEQTAEQCVRYFDWKFPLRPEDQELDGAQFDIPEKLHALLQRQHYRLAWWRTANDTINWRRFFDIPDLIALRQEHDGVFEATHAKILELYEQGLIDGVRIDHVDGLADPAGYCRRLRAALDDRGQRRNPPDPHAYIVVEKILGRGESLSRDWGTDGTTGYDFMNHVSALQHAASGAQPLARLWNEISGRSGNFEGEEILARTEIAQSSFESALSRTSQVFFTVAEAGLSTRDLSVPSIRRVLVRLLEHLRIYRTYQTETGPEPARQLSQAVAAAQEGLSGTDRPALDLVSAILAGDGDREGGREAARRFNQLSAPVAAKAVEDTAFYRYGRLLSRNDVGFAPSVFSVSTAEFHEQMRQRADAFPNALLATATHDHKRGEDVRARLAVLSEIPEAWERSVREWFALNAHNRPVVLDPGDEYQLYQTLVGAWPLDLRPGDAAGLSVFTKRVLAWRQKSLREAKLRTSWLDPDPEYEQANETFIRAVLDPARAPVFLENLAGSVDLIAAGGALNGLVQATLRCTAPGVPDCYQGTEFWDFSLVDPDNRRPVDYTASQHAAIDDVSPADLLSGWRTGQIKQRVIATLLRLRADNAALFAQGGYVPLTVAGAQRDHLLAFMRQYQGNCVLTAVPLRLAAACTQSPFISPEIWGDTAILLPESLPAKSWRNILHGGRQYGSLACADLFASFPIAVLV